MTVILSDKKWFDDLVMELRLRQAQGAAIGDSVASARELLADTGQSAQEAFGLPRDYAAALELPIASDRDLVRWTVWMSLLGLLAFLLFTQTATAWAQGEPFLLSPPQLALLSAPAVLVACLPLYLSAAIRKRWPLVLAVLLCAVTGALSAVVAPATRAEAWLALDPAPLMIGSAGAMVLFSVMSTIRTRRRGDIDDIVDPLAPGPARRTVSARVIPVLTDWLFPILALFTLGQILLLVR